MPSLLQIPEFGGAVFGFLLGCLFTSVLWLIVG